MGKLLYQFIMYNPETLEVYGTGNERDEMKRMCRHIKNRKGYPATFLNVWSPMNAPIIEQINAKNGTNYGEVYVSLDGTTLMRAFDLEKAKSGHPVCTELGGWPVRILCYDFDDPKYPIVACVDDPEWGKNFRQYTSHGLACDRRYYDLMLLETK